MADPAMAGETRRKNAEDPASFQQSHCMERQAWLACQMEQQKSLQDFIKEQANMQQQLLQGVVSPMVGDSNRAEGLGLCKMGPVAFLGTFEWVAMGTDWDRGTWVLRLAPCLLGEAQAAYMAESEEQARNYEVVRAAILGQMCLSTEKYHLKF